MNIILAWLLADFISGIAHWWQDKALLTPSRFAFVNLLKADNDLHHAKPASILKFNAWENVKTSAVLAWPFAVVLYFAGAHEIIWLAVFFSAFGNLVHKWAHYPPHQQRKVNPIVRVLQTIGLMGSWDHHAGHHFLNGRLIVEKHTSTRRYCVMTNWLNPILDSIRFWHLLERTFKLGAKDAL